MKTLNINKSNSYYISRSISSSIKSNRSKCYMETRFKRLVVYEESNSWATGWRSIDGN
jgi:hypothetical protein